MPANAETQSRLADVVSVGGDALTPCSGVAIDRLALLACALAGCQPIPFQIDERDANGRWVLDHGPESTHDEPPDVLDDNDVLLFMASDAGERAAFPVLSRDAPTVEIALHDPINGVTRWAYLVVYPGRAPRVARSYVQYDPTTDRVRGARVSLGFADGVPGYLAIGDGPNLLDRLKVRASATFLFGLIHFSRSEDDLRTEFMGWREGPIRVVRGQRQWVRLGWGIRSPTFGSYTYFYRDSAELPVGLRLNFPPTYFFGNIRVRVILDFRDLRGWSLIVPGRLDPVVIDGHMTDEKAALNELPDAWFALRGPRVTLVEVVEVSASLASTRRRLLYQEDGSTPEPPESVPGEQPGVGYQLDQWEHVGAGTHQLGSLSYALPPEVDVRAFMHARSLALQVSARPLRP